MRTEQYAPELSVVPHPEAPAWRAIRHAFAERTISAFGDCRTGADWCALIGVTPSVLRRRLRHLPPEIALNIPRHAHVDPHAALGSPAAWNWVVLEYEDDPWAQDFVARHPDGASLEEIGDLLGMGKERIRQIEETALAKVRSIGGIELLRQLLREHLNIEDEP